MADLNGLPLCAMTDCGMRTGSPSVGSNALGRLLWPSALRRPERPAPPPPLTLLSLRLTYVAGAEPLSLPR